MGFLLLYGNGFWSSKTDTIRSARTQIMISLRRGGVSMIGIRTSTFSIAPSAVKSLTYFYDNSISSLTFTLSLPFKVRERERESEIIQRHDANETVELGYCGHCCDICTCGLLCRALHITKCTTVKACRSFGNLLHSQRHLHHSNPHV